FPSPEYRKRLDMTFRNSEPTSAHGIDVAAFYPADEMIVYSFPDDFDRTRAKALVEVALREFADLARNAAPTNRSFPSRLFWAAGSTDNNKANTTSHPGKVSRRR